MTALFICLLIFHLFFADLNNLTIVAPVLMSGNKERYSNAAYVCPHQIYSPIQTGFVSLSVVCMNFLKCLCCNKTFMFGQELN